MKKISLLSTLLLLLAQAMYAQQEGLNFQGVARDASGAVMANKNINLQLTIIGTVENGEVGFVEYTEIIQATTNAQGIFAVVIGALGSVEFEAIDWTLVPKYLKVGMDQNGGTQFITMGITQLQTVPFAHFANGVKAEDIDGIVPIEQGGTGVTSIESLKTSLSLETKEDVSNKSTDTSLGTSEELYPTQNAVKSYVDLATNQATTDARYLTLSGGSMSGDIAMGANDISGAGTVSATTFSGDLSGTINTATTATTQSAGDNSTKVATTAYADAALALKVPYTGATGEVDFGAYDLTVNGVMIGKGGVTGNTRIGASALNRNSIGDGVHNTAVGFAAITTAATADNNTGVGYLALFLTTGGDNTAIGNEAGFLNVTGSQNTYIGSKTGSSPNNLTNTTAIGYSASATTSNSIILGNSSIATLRCQVNSISSLSDGRDKTDILTLSEGLDFIKQLKPVTFTWNTRDKAKVGIKSAGFIAQDLLALQQNSTIGANLDLVSFENPDKLEARYANLLPIMVKAIQEETDLRVKEMEVKDQEITDLKERLSSLEDLVNQLLAEQQK